MTDLVALMGVEDAPAFDAVAAVAPTLHPFAAGLATASVQEIEAACADALVAIGWKAVDVVIERDLDDHRAWRLSAEWRLPGDPQLTRREAHFVFGSVEGRFLVGRALVEALEEIDLARREDPDPFAATDCYDD